MVFRFNKSTTIISFCSAFKESMFSKNQDPRMAPGSVTIEPQPVRWLEASRVDS